MVSGIRTTVEFPRSEVCPVVALSEETGTTIDSVTTNSCPSGCGASVVEFSMAATAAVDDDAFELLFSANDTERYRLVRDGDETCPCEFLAECCCPVDRYVAEKGTLTLVFHASDRAELRDVIADLDERFPSMDVKRFVRSPAGASTGDHVLVDRSRLTARQLEVLETAYEMGYFERSRRTNATAVAAELDVTPSTFLEHLAAVESKIMEEVL